MTRRIPLLPAALSFALLGLLPPVHAAHAQAWTEIGDAGSLVSTAQNTSGTGPLTVIYGQLSDSTDVDMYCIHVTNAATFSARLQCFVNMGPNIWLFDASGMGRAHQDLCQYGDKDVNGFSIPGPGWYFVAVAASGMQAQSPGGAIWLTNLFNPVERAPDGPGAPGPLVGWSGPALNNNFPAYTIFLYGTDYCSLATPTRRGTWGSLKSIYR